MCIKLYKIEKDRYLKTKITDAKGNIIHENKILVSHEIFQPKCPNCGAKDYKQVIYDSDVPEYQCNKCGTYFKDKFANSSVR